MTELRQRMVNDMILRGMAEKTRTSYTQAVAGLAKFYRRSPDQITHDEVQAYLLHLIQERKLAWSTCNIAVHGLRFLFHTTLGHDTVAFHICAHPALRVARQSAAAHPDRPCAASPWRPTPGHVLQRRALGRCRPHAVSPLPPRPLARGGDPAPARACSRPDRLQYLLTVMTTAHARPRSTADVQPIPVLVRLDRRTWAHRGPPVPLDHATPPAALPWPPHPPCACPRKIDHHASSPALQSP
ncbi:MAG: phage integrase N-terminal SAM-like domain-containing protein [Acidobacteria bacterium]|nr:phage integrase N-terminal SAM-like domain-containing protein [Acidobacteriota bacterium]